MADPTRVRRWAWALATLGLLAGLLIDAVGALLHAPGTMVSAWIIPPAGGLAIALGLHGMIFRREDAASTRAARARWGLPSADQSPELFVFGGLLAIALGLFFWWYFLHGT